MADKVKFSAEMKKFNLRARNEGDICEIGFILPAKSEAAQKLQVLYGEQCKIEIQLDDSTKPLFPTTGSEKAHTGEPTLQDTPEKAQQRSEKHNARMKDGEGMEV